MPTACRPEAGRRSRRRTRWKARSTSGRCDEVRALLGDDSRAFELRYGLLPDGNAPFDPQNEFTGKNLLYTARGIADDRAASSGASRRTSPTR